MKTLRRLRDEAGLSTRQLGKLAGLSHGQISHVENGHSDMSRASIGRLAAALAKALGRPRAEVLSALVYDGAPTLRPTPAGHCTPAAEEAA